MKIGAWDSDSGEVYVIAEAGVNHNGSMNTASDLIDAARAAGADAVKFQWFSTDALVQRRGPQAEALRQYEFTAINFRYLSDYAKRLGLPFLCSVFDQESADAYLALDPPAVKIGSGELTYNDLLVHVARAGLPTILSTGMATMQQIKNAIRCLTDYNNILDRLALLHCVSAYPTPLDQVNLRALDALKAFHCPVGWSDHTNGFYAAPAAVARGAVIIEKHLTLSHDLPGPDHKASMEPEGFAYMVAAIRQTTRMLGSGEKIPQPCEAETMKACGRV